MRNYDSKAKFEDLKGAIISTIDGLETGSETVDIRTQDGKHYRMAYYQDCCASCSVEEIHGDVADLLNSPILLAEEVCNADEPSKKEHPESFTWTFYKLATIKGSVTIRWYGSSNGYYCESPDFEEAA